MKRTLLDGKLLPVVPEDDSNRWRPVQVGAALDMISQGESLARIMLRGGWKTESTALRYLRNYKFD